MGASGESNRRIQIYQRREMVERRALHFQQYEIHALFDELIHKPWGMVRWNPAVDVRESKDAFTIEIDLPGVKSEDVRLLAQGKTLVIEGRRRLQSCEDERAAHLCERPDGRFSRTFEFDDVIESREIHSRWQDGVLTVTVPKSRDE